MSSNNYWNKAELMRLRYWLKTDASYEEIAERMGRTVGAIRVKASKIGASRKKYDKEGAAVKIDKTTPGVVVHRLI